MTQPPDELYGQYFLAEVAEQTFTPGGWTVRQVDRWKLVTHPLLPVVELREDGSNRTAGWLIGWAIGEGGLIRGQEIRITQIDASFSSIETWLDTLSGRFAAVVVPSAGSARMYLDASGSLAAVYATDRKLIASTPSAIALASNTQAAYRQTKNAEPALPANHFYPGNLTGDANVLRLLPNHFLHLDSWKAQRHWPTAPINRVGDSDARALAEKIAANTRHCIESLAKVFELAAGLSAGRDSRMMLACAKNVLDRVEFVTFNYKDPAKFADVHIAQKLAKKFRLKYRVLDLIDPPKQMKADYLYRVGYTNNSGKACDFYDACHRLIDMNRAWLVGYGGEVGRAFYWKSDDREKSADEITPADLLDRMHLPADPIRLDAMTAWKASLPAGCDAYLMLDLMYQELRLGCWASPQIYAAAPFAANVMPLSHRANYAAMMAMPIDYRLRQGLADDVIRTGWPELLTMTFQDLTGWRRSLRELKKRILRKLR